MFIYTKRDLNRGLYLIKNTLLNYGSTIALQPVTVKVSSVA